MENYIKKSSEKVKSNLKEYYLHDKPVYFLEKIKNVNLDYVFDKISDLIPKEMTNNFESIYVGQFEEFKKDNKMFNAMFKDGVIYVSSEQNNESDMIDDIIHEIAHSLEKEVYNTLFDDNAIEREFLAKRRVLFHDLGETEINLLYFLNPNYDSAFDSYLYKTIGYDRLRLITSNLFYSPYAATSLKEYWANGFENFFLGDKQRLKDLSPILYNKIIKVIKNLEEKNGY